MSARFRFWTLCHMPLSRSTRVLWTWKELKRLYPDGMPELDVFRFDRTTFRWKKPKWFLDLNPNGKAPCLIESDVRILSDTLGIDARTEGIVGAKTATILIESGACVASLLRRFDVQSRLLSSDTKEQDIFWQTAFYCTGTIDNLTATSSLFQGVVDMDNHSSSSVLEATRASGWDDETRRRAWKFLCAPMLRRLLDGRMRRPAAEHKFSAIDVFVGMPLFWLDQKKGWLADVPELESYYRERISPRRAFRDAIGDAPGGFE